MIIRRFSLMALLFTTLILAGMPSLAQDDDPITLVVDAGFDHFYRPGYWLPLQIQVQNEGIGFSGRLTVRPETSGRAVNSAYSTPIDLPTGSDKTVFLYIQAQQSSGTLIVELIDEEGVRFAERAVGITAVNPNDSLHMVVSGTAANSIPLNTVSQMAYISRQGRWEVDNVPPDVAAMEAIDTLILYDVESEQFTLDQLEAIEAWVLTGGHLIVAGGPGWTQTTSALDDELLPFIATGSESIDDISPLGAYIDSTETLSGQIFITTGTVADSAQVLIESDAGLPLLLRREYGIGVVDFLTVDPTLEPMRSWSGLRDFWFNVLSTVPPEPGWSRGWLDLQDAARALAILPDVELLPPVSSMILFIVAYIVLIGPVNYIVLSRFRRRALAWGTIPILILTFTLLAWNVGFNLRGNEVIISRLYVVQSFSDSDIAYQQQLAGVLSPRRETYTITAPANTVLGTLPGVEDDSPFSANVTRSTADVSQGQQFAVENIPIDGGIFANFSLDSIVTAPAISGEAIISYLPHEPEVPLDGIIVEPTPLSIRGFVRNDSELSLENVLVLVRNRYYRVEGNFEPGDVLDFDNADFLPITSNPASLIPIASPLQSSAITDIAASLSSRTSINQTLVTSRVLLNLNWSTGTNVVREDTLLDFDDDEMNRRRALLRAFMRDQYQTPGVGNQAYVIAWTSEQQADDVRVSDVAYRPVDTSMYILELDTSLETAPSDQLVTLSADQFTWVMTDATAGQVLGSLNDLTIINPGWAEFQVMPIDGAVLSDVSELIIELNRSTARGRQVELAVWNFETGEWDLFENVRFETYQISDPAPYLGHHNRVKLRFSIDEDFSAVNANARVLQLRVIQRGRFQG